MAERKPSECKSCGFKITWFKNHNNKWIPVNWDSVEKSDVKYEFGKHVDHRDTCVNRLRDKNL